MSTSDTPVLDRVTDPSALRQMSDADLQTLAAELRAETIATVSRTGGHLGSSLGVVELTIALHAVFSTPEDTLIWDVGHQTYPHKILTGRRAQMGSLRQWGGLSGFTKRSESDYDPFGAAHSSTSVSAALGFAVARDLGSRRGDVVAVIGDGAMSAGMAYEALNNAGAEGRRLFVILNDNGMSIAPPVGAMAGYLAGLSASAAPEVDGKAQAEGKTDTIFGALGFDYVGPVDGHDLSVLLPLLRAQRAQADRPVLIHCRTVKGKGYKPAEESDDKYHGVTKFEVATGRQSKSAGGAPSYTSVFGSTLTDLAATDPKIVAITAAMPDGTGVDIMRRRFPDRVFDVGIAEQHGVTFAAGLAAAGMTPFVAIYSTFLQRAYDQVVHDVALQGLPVRFAIDRAGLVGADGATHAGAFDIAYLSCLPGFTVMAAADEADLKHMVTTAAAYDAGPISFRFPRGAGVGVSLPETGQVLPIGRGRVVAEGQDVALLSFGAHLAECRAAADLLAEKGISATVADARFAKPLDMDLLGHLARHHRALFTVEEGAAGGFGAMVLQSLAETGLLDRGLAVRTLCLPDRYIDQGTPAEMYADAGLSAEAIATRVRAVLGQ